MSAPFILVALLCFLEPESMILPRGLQHHLCLEPFLLSWLPLLVAAVATALVLAVNSIMQVMCQEDCVSPNDRSQFRSEQ
jgi:hypothetical protein